MELVDIKEGDQLAFVTHTKRGPFYELHTIQYDSESPGYFRCGPYILDQNYHVFSGGGKNGPHYGMPVTDEIRKKIRLNDIRRAVQKCNWEYASENELLTVAALLGLEDEDEDYDDDVWDGTFDDLDEDDDDDG